MLVSKYLGFSIFSIFTEQLTYSRPRVRHEEYGSKRRASLPQISLSGLYVNQYLSFTPLQIRRGMQ